jgi:hypothetical protein
MTNGKQERRLMKTTTIELTVERHQRLTIRRNNTPTQAWCAACDAEVLMFNGEDAARLSGQTSRAIYRQVEQGLLHFSERPDGTLLVCVQSLIASVIREIRNALKGETKQ